MGLGDLEIIPKSEGMAAAIFFIEVNSRVSLGVEVCVTV